ncbi:type I-E CRISPR-associated protein Cas6/Cse3/CasE [Pseudonocardia sp. CA-107938]|uniref:type I-E CRISPR-associated protein Cas6/Cse3/CasE n=1 Tax=Pseudonocardia sp. CA-107938 TaxID=3240021 RepID=UPI003D93EA0E
MPYLSRIWLNPLRSRAQLFLANPHALHAAVLGGLSRQPVTERVLWRLNTDFRHRAEVLVLTESMPSWEHLVEQAGWASADEPQEIVRDYQPLLDKVQRGREFRLRVRANPVSSTRRPDKPSPAQQKQLAKERRRGVRVAHRTAGHQLRWFTDHLEGWGFETVLSPESGPRVALSARDRLVFTKNGGHRVVLNTATFDAVVRVTDPAIARERLLGGVGPAKGYGCGLITLAPVTASGA